MTIALPPAMPRSEAVSRFLERASGRLLLDGEWVPAAAGETFETRDPATGELLASVARARGADVEAAVASSRRALEAGPWPALTPEARAALLWRIADLLEANIDELSELETLDQGKVLRTARLG